MTTSANKSHTWRAPRAKPVVGITTDLIPHNNMERHASPVTYAHAVARAGGVPMLVPPIDTTLADVLRLCDAFVLTGGDDPIMEAFGGVTHPEAVRVKESRQRFEVDLLAALAEARPDVPVLGVCLGMQYMALHAGGTLNQHLPATHRTHAEHWDHSHPITTCVDSIEPGTVWSRHRQAIESPGSLTVAATAHDGVIEAVADPDRRFYLGVQWHPERTDDPAVGQRVFDRLVAASR